ncbi:MAG: hypothetical protein WCP79_15685, partial [Bacillota bacterium]
MIQKLTNRRGSAMLISLLIIVVLGGILTAASPMIINDLKYNMINVNSISAQFAAEAGAKVAIAALFANSTDWSWLAQNQYLLSGDTTKTYQVTISPAISGAPAANTTYTITSVGTVASANSSNSATRRVVVTVTTAAGTNSVFTNAAFSGENMTINGGLVNGNIATNGSLTDWVSGTSVNGTATSQTFTGRRSSITGKTYCNNNNITYCDQSTTFNGTVDVASYMQAIPAMPAIPTFTKTGTDINTKASGALAGGSYYSNSSVGLNGKTFTIASGNSILIYVVGNFQMDSSSFSGGNITIYATGSITMN